MQRGTECSVYNSIYQKLYQRFFPDFLEIIDESHLHKGHNFSSPHGETHFRIIIKDKNLAQMKRIDAHRLINETLKEEFNAGVHAISIQISKPDL